HSVARLLPLVLSADTARSAALAQRVQLIDENDARRFRLRLREHIAHASGADADEHLDEIRAAEAEKRNTGLTGDRLGQQCFACSRRTYEQHALGNPTTEFLILVRQLQKIDHLADFFNRLVDS